jgi:hypothetical protein
MLEKILVGEKSPKRAPGRVRMLEFVGIEEANGKRGNPRQEKANHREPQVADGKVGFAPGSRGREIVR